MSRDEDEAGLVAPESGTLRAAEADDLKLAYAALSDARGAHAAFLVERRQRERELADRAHHVKGALEVARALLEAEGGAEEGGPVVPAGVGGGGGEAGAEVSMAPFEAELGAAREAFEAWVAEASARHERAIAEAQEAVVRRVEAWLAHARPRLEVEVARVAGGKAVVHLPRPRGDEAVLLCAILCGRPPETYGFLEEETVEHVDEAPLRFVVLPGVDPEALRAGGAGAEDALVRSWSGPLLPIRLHLPLLDPALAKVRPWPRLRLCTRGPVLELESRLEGEPYTHLVPAEHAEVFTGYLVALQARGRLEVSVDLG